MREQFDPHLLEPPRQKHLLPRLRRGRLLPATGDDPQPVAEDANRARRPSFEQLPDLLPNKAPIARRERKGEHHVAHHEPPTRPEDPPGLGERKLFPGIVEMVERVIGDHESGRLVLKRESAEIGDEPLDVVHPVSGGCIIEPLQHPLGDVDRYHLAYARGERQGQKTGAGAKVDHLIVAGRLG